MISSSDYAAKWAMFMEVERNRYDLNIIRSKTASIWYYAWANYHLWGFTWRWGNNLPAQANELDNESKGDAHTIFYIFRT